MEGQIIQGSKTTYKLVGTPISSGTHGTVYQAVDTRDGRVYAAKIAEKRSRVDERSVDRLLREAQLLRSAPPHPCVSRVYDSGMLSATSAYAVMDLAAGGPLFDAVLQVGRYNEINTAMVMWRVLRALEHLHRNRIMHRDVKPENILLVHNPSQNLNAAGRPVQSRSQCSAELTEVLLADFGLATSEIPNSGCVGSPQYAAPEIASIGISPANASLGMYDQKCDIWSAGILAYVLLSGLLPFDGPTPLSVFQSVLKGRYDFTHVVWQTVSDDAKAFVTFLLDSRPSTRPSAKQAISHPWLQRYCRDKL